MFVFLNLLIGCINRNSDSNANQWKSGIFSVIHYQRDWDHLINAPQVINSPSSLTPKRTAFDLTGSAQHTPCYRDGGAAAFLIGRPLSISDNDPFK